VQVTVAIIGAGVAGRSFALVCAAAGLTVILEDVMPEKLRHAESDFTSLGHTVQLVSTVEDAVHSADIVIDFVPDELESKLEIWSLIDRMAPPKTVICTPSDVLSITDLASCTYRPDRCIMFRGNLQDAAPIAILSATSTSETTRTMTESLFQRLGLPTIQSPDPVLPQLLKNMNALTL
jgi:3-hydroxybutyryl-CoA dehydrogenase